jgi:hypothetical protein
MTLLKQERGYAAVCYSEHCSPVKILSLAAGFVDTKSSMTPPPIRMRLHEIGRIDCASGDPEELQTQIENFLRKAINVRCWALHRRQELSKVIELNEHFDATDEEILQAATNFELMKL